MGILPGAPSQAGSCLTSLCWAALNAGLFREENLTLDPVNSEMLSKVLYTEEGEVGALLIQGKGRGAISQAQTITQIVKKATHAGGRNSSHT